MDPEAVAPSIIRLNVNRGTRVDVLYTGPTILLCELNRQSAWLHSGLKYSCRAIQRKQEVAAKRTPSTQIFRGPHCEAHSPSWRGRRCGHFSTLHRLCGPSATPSCNRKLPPVDASAAGASDVGKLSPGLAERVAHPGRATSVWVGPRFRSASLSVCPHPFQSCTVHPLLPSHHQPRKVSCKLTCKVRCKVPCNGNVVKASAVLVEGVRVLCK